MQYRLYQYTLEDANRRLISPDRHIELFKNSVGFDGSGRLTEYRGERNTVLMYVRTYDKNFTGLIGRHSTEREVTDYVDSADETTTRRVGDDDYPHVAFICMPRIRMIALVDGGPITPDSAIQRLHQILAHRQNAYFIAESVKEAFDLRRAVDRFRVVEVSFEILPVNPHTGDIGKKLDESRKIDHIKKIIGKAVGSKDKPLKLEG